MKINLTFYCLLLPAFLSAQSLRDFDIQEMAEQQIPIFVDHPNEAAVVFYTAISNLTVESNTGGVVAIRKEATKLTVFLRPERQILTLKAPGFIEKKQSLSGLTAKQALFYRVNERAETYTAEKGSFLINTVPEGAMLKIDGFPTFKQLTPFDLKDFEAKKYRINLTKPDYYPLDTLIEIRQGIKQSGLFELRSMYGTLSLKAPATVKVKVNAIEYDVGPEMKSLRLTEGYYTITVNDPRFEPYRETITVPSGGSKIVDLPLVKKAGYLQIIHPEGFTVTVNGEAKEKKPGPVMLEFFEGSYKAEVNRPGYQAVTYLFTIRKGDVVNWEPVFTPVTVAVKLQTEPAGATVQLKRGSETELLGFTPLEEQIAVGDVEFLVKREGFKDFQFKTTLEEGKPLTKTINLADPAVSDYRVVKGIKTGKLTYNGFTYTTVVIVTQEWTVENLRTTTYNDGTSIKKITNDKEWTTTDAGAYCAYDNNESNVATYGYLYNWYAVNTGKLAPGTGGWRVPTDEDWQVLEKYLGMSEGDANKTGYRGTDQGGKLKEAGMAHWERPNAGASNSSGFSALPGGGRDGDYGTFYYLGYGGFWWSSTASDTSYAWYRSMSNGYANVSRYGYYHRSGFSVRLVRDL